jgi:hypothetical protein
MKEGIARKTTDKTPAVLQQGKIIVRPATHLFRHGHILLSLLPVHC